jgi:uncharacterized protein (TIGR03118 family)
VYTFVRNAALSLLAISVPGASALSQQYNQVNLVANTSGVAPTTDSSLVNPWGLTRGSGTPWWVADNATGVSTLYTGAGTKAALTVTIPPAKAGTPGSPTGTIFNGSKTDFLLAANTPALFLFSTIDGMIVGWNPATGAVPVVKTKNHSVYTGLTSATVKGETRLYAANFALGRVDVYDSAFQPIHRGDEHFKGEERFDDDWLPRNYVPFNVQAIGNDIVVTYALHFDNDPHEADGPGRGFVDIFSSEGRLLQRLDHGDWLNAPWGVALAPLDFGAFSHDLLIAQFAGGGTTDSSGYIAAYDLATGRFKGLLQDASGNPLAINGIWAISPGNAPPNNFDPAGAPSGELYFTAGPNHGSGGLFGYLTAVAADLTRGSAQ